MKHKKHNKSLGRKANHRKALMKNLTSSLLVNGSLVTTKAKATEFKKHFEPLVTQAKKELTLARRRILLRKLGQSSDLTPLHELAKKQKDRPGGYLRTTKLPITRADAAQEVRIDIVE